MGWAVFQNAVCTFFKSISADKTPQMLSQFTSQPAVPHSDPNDDTIFSNISISLIFLVITLALGFISVLRLKESLLLDTFYVTAILWTV